MGHSPKYHHVSPHTHLLLQPHGAYQEAQRRQPRECFSETQWKRGDAAGRKCKTCCSNAARGVVLAKPCVGCGNLKQRESFSARQWERKESKCADCLSGPKSLGRPNYPRGEGRPGEKPAGSGVVSKTQPCSAATDGGGVGSPGGLAASPHRSPTQEEEAESDGGQELLRNAAELGRRQPHLGMCREQKVRRCLELIETFAPRNVFRFLNAGC